MQKIKPTSSGFISAIKNKWLIGAVLTVCIVIVYLLSSGTWPGTESRLSRTYLQYIERGDRALMNDSVETALQSYFRALDIDNRRPEIFGKISETYFFAALRHRQGNNIQMMNSMMTQCLLFLDQGRQKGSNDPYLHYVTGLLAMERNRTDSAISEMAYAYSQGVRTFKLHVHLSDLYNEKEETPLCLEHLLIAYEMKPNDPQIVYNLGEIYFRTGNFSKAVKYHSLLVEIDPNAVEYKAVYAASLWKSGDEKTAKNLFNQILQDPNVNQLERHHVVAWTLIDRDVDYEWGIKVANVTAEIKRDITSFDILGWGYYKTGDYVKSVRYLTMSYNQSPNAEVKRRLEMAQEKLKTAGK